MLPYGLNQDACLRYRLSTKRSRWASGTTYYPSVRSWNQEMSWNWARRRRANYNKEKWLFCQRDAIIQIRFYFYLHSDSRFIVSNTMEIINTFFCHNYKIFSVIWKRATITRSTIDNIVKMQIKWKLNIKCNTKVFKIDQSNVMKYY